MAASRTWAGSVACCSTTQGRVRGYVVTAGHTCASSVTAPPPTPTTCVSVGEENRE